MTSVCETFSTFIILETRIEEHYERFYSNNVNGSFIHGNGNQNLKVDVTSKGILEKGEH